MCVILEQFSYLKQLKLNSNFYKFIFTHIVCINSSTSALISVCISKSSYLIAFLLIRLLFQCLALAYVLLSKTNQKTRAPIRCATKEQLNDPIRAAFCISASLFFWFVFASKILFFLIICDWFASMPLTQASH